LCTLHMQRVLLSVHTSEESKVESIKIGRVHEMKYSLFLVMYSWFKLNVQTIMTSW
jgi:hypothetical protein